MSVKEMDTIHVSSYENNEKQVLKSKNKPIHFRNDSHSVRILEDLQSLRKYNDSNFTFVQNKYQLQIFVFRNEVLCDAKFEANDGKIVIGHKNVLIAASPYFREIFNNFDDSNKDLINIKELDSSILQQLVDYIYTGEIVITKENVQV